MPQYCSLALLLHATSLASAASWHLGYRGLHELRASQTAEADTIKAPSCLPDMPGGRLAAGASMTGCIALTAACTVAIAYYLIRCRTNSLDLPVSVGQSAASGGGNPSDNGQGAAQQPLVKKKRVYMYSLDGIRTLLVLAVIFAHYPMGLPSICKHFLGWPMQFFFVLSGFVAQMQQEASSDFSWISGLTYIARRLFRILPLYQLALVFQFILAIYANRSCQPVIAWPLNALLLQVLLPVPVCGDHEYAWTMGYTHFNGNGPSWFAACIIWFSCLFPLLYNARPRSGGLYTFGFLIAILGFRAVPDLVHPTWGTYGAGAHLYAMSPVRLLEYTAGMWAAQVAAEAAQRWPDRNCWCWLFDVTLVLMVATVYVSMRFLGATWTCSGDYHLTAICCFVCIAARLAAEMPEESKQGFQGAILHRVIGSTPLTYLARFSFAAYIFQTSFMSFTDADQNFYVHRFCALWLFSIFATIYIEEPIRLAAEARLKGKS